MKKENLDSAISGSGGKFNYIVVALQFVTCDKNERRWGKKKNEIKGTIGRTNLFFCF